MNPKYEIKYTDDLPAWVGGRCVYPALPYFGIGTCVVQLIPKYRDDKGLLNHELKHVEQYNRSWFHVLKYKFNNKYRMECELEAYAEQVKVYKYTKVIELDWIVTAMCTKYQLEISEDYVRARLKAELC